MARLSARTRGLLYTNLEKYARNGMGMEKACQALLGQPGTSKTERSLCQGFLEGLRQGRSIAESLGGEPGLVSALEREVVAAAESGGRLDAGFAHLGAYYQRLDRTRRRILRGLAYPLVLLHLVIPVSIVATGAFRGFSLDGSSPPWSFREALVQCGLAFLGLYITAFLLYWVSRFLVRKAESSVPVDRFLERIPFLGKARKWTGLERFSSAFEILLLSGRRMSDCLEGAGRASGSGQIRVASVAGGKIIALGNPLAEALRVDPGPFPDDFVTAIAVAEEAGQLDETFAEWARSFAESAREAMDQLGEWVPKLFYWAVLLVVSLAIIRAALAYRDLIGGILDRIG